MPPRIGGRSAIGRSRDGIRRALAITIMPAGLHLLMCSRMRMGMPLGAGGAEHVPLPGPRGLAASSAMQVPDSGFVTRAGPRWHGGGVATLRARVRTATHKTLIATPCLADRHDVLADGPLAIRVRSHTHVCECARAHDHTHTHVCARTHASGRAHGCGSVCVTPLSGRSAARLRAAHTMRKGEAVVFVR